MPILGKTLPSAACAVLVASAGPLAAEMVSQTGEPLQVSGSIGSGQFIDEGNRTIGFDPFDASLGTLTGMTLDYRLSSNVLGSFNHAAQGGGWHANTVVVIEWAAGGFRREDGDGDGNGGGKGGSDPVDVSADLSGSVEARDLAAFQGDGQTEVFLKYLFNLDGGPGTFAADYDFYASVILTYDYDKASNGGHADGGEETGGGEADGGN